MNDTDAAFSELSEDALRGYLHEYVHHHLGFSLTLPPPPSVLYLLYPSLPYPHSHSIRSIMCTFGTLRTDTVVYQLGTKGR